MIKSVEQHTGSRAEKFYKTTLFQSTRMLLGLNCLEPGQIQPPHDHADQDKFYYIVEGDGLFSIDQQLLPATAGDVVWAPAGVPHGVENRSESRLTLLVGIAPAP